MEHIDKESLFEYVTETLCRNMSGEYSYMDEEIKIDKYNTLVVEVSISYEWKGIQERDGEDGPWYFSTTFAAVHVEYIDLYVRNNETDETSDFDYSGLEEKIINNLTDYLYEQ